MLHITRKENMNSIAVIKGIITKLCDTVILANGDSIRNLVVCCELDDKKHTKIFHDVILWNDLTNIRIKKNDKIIVSGELKYKLKDGSKFSEIIAKEIEIR